MNRSFVLVCGLFIAIAMALFVSSRPAALSMSPASSKVVLRAPVFSEEMTWQEVRDALKAGKTTILIPTGGVEQNGPYVVTGKHNYIIRATADAIARKLGNALVAPVVPFVPEGRIEPPTGHMKFPGTISVSQKTFRVLLADICASYRAHGFQNIVLFGDSGGNQKGMNAVAAKLNAAWVDDKTRVHFIPEYYDAEWLEDWLEKQGIHEVEEGIHDSYAVEAMLAAIDPKLMRMEPRIAAGKFKINSVDLAPVEKTAAIGRKIIDLYAETTVKAIEKSLTRPALESIAKRAAMQTEAKKKSADEKAIRALIEKLGDGDFDVRESAHKKLADAGEPALPLLRAAAKEHPDLEVRERLGQLIQAIGSSLFVEIRKFERKGYWTSRLVMAADGKHVVAVSGGALRCLNLDDGSENVRFDFPIFPGNSWGLSRSADGQRVIVASEDRVARIYDLKAGNLIKELKGHAGAVNGAVLLPDGKRALTAGTDQTLRLWDIDSGQQIRGFDNVTNQTMSLGLSPDGKLVAVALSVISELETPGDIGIWEVESGRRIHLLKGHTKRLCSVRFSPDGKTVLSSSFDHTARLWDVSRGELLKTFTGHAGKLEGAAFTPDGKRFVSVGNQDNPVVIVWDVASGERLFQSGSLSTGLLDVVTLPDGRRCVTCGKDGTIRLWEWKR